MWTSVASLISWHKTSRDPNWWRSGSFVPTNGAFLFKYCHSQLYFGFCNYCCLNPYCYAPWSPTLHTAELIVTKVSWYNCWWGDQVPQSALVSHYCNFKPYCDGLYILPVEALLWVHSQKCLCIVGTKNTKEPINKKTNSRRWYIPGGDMNQLVVVPPRMPPVTANGALGRLPRLPKVSCKRCSPWKEPCGAKQWGLMSPSARHWRTSPAGPRGLRSPSCATLRQLCLYLQWARVEK